jgi:hypothetical protein
MSRSRLQTCTQAPARAVRPGQRPVGFTSATVLGRVSWRTRRRRDRFTTQLRRLLRRYEERSLLNKLTLAEHGSRALAEAVAMPDKHDNTKIAYVTPSIA